MANGTVPVFPIRRWILCLTPVLIFSTAFGAEVQGALVNHAADYTFGYYPYGWRGQSPRGDRIYAIQTNRYALTINTSTGRIERLGPIHDAPSAFAAAQQGNELLDTLPSLDLTFEVHVGGVSYTVTQGSAKHDDVILQRIGKYLQHVEVRNLVLRAPDGTAFTQGLAWFEVYAWPDRLSVIFHVEGDTARDCEIRIVLGDSEYRLETEHEEGHRILTAGDRALAVLSPDPNGAVMTEVDGHLMLTEPCAGNGACSAALVVVPATREDVRELARREWEFMRSQAAKPGLAADGISPYAESLPVSYDPIVGWHRVVLGSNPDKDITERVRVLLSNESDMPSTFRLCFAKDGGGYSITGMSPMLRDAEGLPIGLPVQISKNWHCKPPWFNGLAVVDLEPRSSQEFEFTLAYATWGGVPAVSHAQLCLVGWGTNQQWDQMAIGSFGESICYDPDVNLNRSMIDDMRPLMVWGMGKQPNVKWSWTHNVGGGDFLVRYQQGKQQYLKRQKTLYESYGPVLSDVTYAGETPDGSIQSVIRTQSWRSDDYVRGLYTLHYDVKRHIESIDRIAFFQLGADRYNGNLFDSLSRGTKNGLTEAWAPAMGGRQYSRRGLPLDGDQPWLAMTGARKNPPPHIDAEDQGAWANRGLIVRGWKARLGGRDVTQPHYSVFGTEDGGIPSALIELSPPAEVTRLEAGDFLEAQVEMLVLPQRAGDYYGPNEGLRAALEEHPDDWHLVYREASRNPARITARAGSVEGIFPAIVRATQNGTRAEFTLSGGVGYVPITNTGVASRGPFALSRSMNGTQEVFSEASASGNDWWQCTYRPESQTYDLTFTLPTEITDDETAWVWSLSR
ncbi:MAG: hypothetical protein IT365_01595 [Candidatus Hydrogenedentes bacterium]|nr:hypothetical protein [Candidatus Hydrogenedentota bacterium]